MPEESTLENLETTNVVPPEESVVSTTPDLFSSFSWIENSTEPSGELPTTAGSNDSTIPRGENWLGTANNIFLEEGQHQEKEQPDVSEKENFVSHYIRWFIASSILTIIAILIIGLTFSYNTYISQTSQLYVDSTYTNFVTKYKTYLEKGTSLLGINQESMYVGLPIVTLNDEANVRRIIDTPDLSYAQKKDILRAKVSSLSSNIANKAQNIEDIKKDIARFGFLPQEIRTILQGDEAIATIQRSLNSLEIIKFSTALNVFSYMESAVSIISDGLSMTKEAVFAALDTFAKRGEKDVSAYVYMCYLNPFEVSQECDSIGDFDLYYQDILKDTDFDRTLFKKVMKYLDNMLEQSDIPSFSILFNGFNAGDKTINFTIEVNTTKQDELRLIAKGIKNPQIFILTSLINLLKQSVFIIGGDIDTKTINITTRTIEIWNTTYTVNTSSKNFSLPIQKSTEREIFDYIDIDSLLLLDMTTSGQALTEWELPPEEYPADTLQDTSDASQDSSQDTSDSSPDTVQNAEEVSPIELPSEDQSEEFAEVTEVEEVTEATELPAEEISTPPAGDTMLDPEVIEEFSEANS